MSSTNSSAEQQQAIAKLGEVVDTLQNVSNADARSEIAKMSAKKAYERLTKDLGAPFSPKQKEAILLMLAWVVVETLHEPPKPLKGMKKHWSQFCELGIGGKLAVIVALLGICATVFNGGAWAVGQWNEHGPTLSWSKPSTPAKAAENPMDGQADNPAESLVEDKNLTADPNR